MTEANNLTGTKLGDYQLGQYLGNTGVADVYQANNPEVALPLAVNVLSLQMVDDQDFYTQLLVKIGVLAELNHANIVSVVDFGVDEYAYTVTPYLTGPTLGDLMNSAKRQAMRIPMDSAIFIMNSVVDGLLYAHKMGIPHGDLSAANILLGEEGGIVLLDYGLAQAARQLRPTIPDAKDMTMISFSQVDVRQGFKKDIRAVGKIYYELVTSRELKRDEDSNEYIPPSKYVSDVPNAIEAVIMRALGGGGALQPYKSIDEMQQDLRHYKGKIKTTVLPTARLSDVIAFSSRFAQVGVPEDIQKEVRSVALHFMDTGQVLELRSGGRYSLGRKSEGQAVVPDIDLSPFNAYEWGISRLHATLDIGEDKITIMDENSSNGTYHAGIQIQPKTAYELHSGDMILLGKLRIQILVSE